MEITVTLQLQGEHDEIAVLLSQIGELLGERSELLAEGAEPFEGGEVAAARPNGARPSEDPGWWTPERAETFVRGLTLPALQALGVIAQSAPSMSFVELQRRMGARGMQLAGRLSSIGFAVTRHGTPFPFARNYYQRTYLMDEGVAAIFRPAVEQELARRSSHELAAAGGALRQKRR